MLERYGVSGHRSNKMVEETIDQQVLAAGLKFLCDCYTERVFNLGVTDRIIAWYSGGRISSQSESFSKSLVDMVDDPEDIPDYTDADKASRRLDVGKVPRMAVHFATMARNEIPLLTRDRANMLVVRQFIVRSAKIHGMRPSHISKILSLSVELAFMPNVYDCTANEVAASVAYNDRVDLYESQRWTRERPWLLNWLGNKRVQRPYSAV